MTVRNISIQILHEHFIFQIRESNFQSSVERNPGVRWFYFALRSIQKSHAAFSTDRFSMHEWQRESFHDIKNYRYVITLFCCAIRNIFGILIAVRSKELECNSRLIFPASLKNIRDITLNYLSPSTHSFVKFLQLDSQLLDVVHQNAGRFSLVTPHAELSIYPLSILKQHILHSLQIKKERIC